MKNMISMFISEPGFTPPNMEPQDRFCDEVQYEGDYSVYHRGFALEHFDGKVYSHTCSGCGNQIA